MKSEDRTHDAECLRALAEFLPKFEAAWGLEDSKYFYLSKQSFDLISGFHETCYRIGWILYPGFRWSTWITSPEAIRLHDDPAVLEQATIEQLQKLLTYLCRQDRFCEGVLENAFKSGLLVRILRRIAALAANPPVKGKGQGAIQGVNNKKGT